MGLYRGVYGLLFNGCSMVAQWLFNGVQQNWIRGFDVVTLHQLKRRTEGDE